MSTNSDLAVFSSAIERAVASIERKEFMRPVRRILGKYYRRLRTAVASDLSAGAPALGSRVACAVRGRVYRDTTGLRVYVANNRRLGQGMQATFRPSQPKLPLAYWFEHGYAGPRQTRHGGHNRGGGFGGVHALQRHQGELSALERDLMAELEPYLPKLIDYV